MTAIHRASHRLLPVAALSVAALACSLLSSGGDPGGGGNGGGGNGGNGNGGDEPESNILFSDDFSDTSSGWDQTSDSTTSTDYDDGTYRMWVDEPNMDVWANPGKDFRDVVVSVEATKIGGPDDNDFGVICRYQDTENFYFLIISSDGYAVIGEVLDGESAYLSSDKMQPTDAIEQGEATNVIEAECVGDSLTLRVNGDEVAQVDVSDFSSGDVGLMAGTFDEPGAEIAFDNFEVRRP